MGYPLSQTIFTSLHINRILMSTPLGVEDTHFDKKVGYSSDEPLTARILRAYCLGLIKTCSFVINRVKSEHFFEVCFLYIYSTCLGCLLMRFRKKILL